MALAKRELGRMGLQVTTLGYGAMENRHSVRQRRRTAVRNPQQHGKAKDAPNQQSLFKDGSSI